MNRLLNLITILARLCVAAVFIYASHDKIWEPAAFAHSMAQYDILPLALVNPASVWLAWLEMFTGVLVLAGPMVRPAAGWAAFLLVFFIGLMFWAEATGAGYDCGCFPGSGGHAAGLETAIRDMVFLVPTLWVLARPHWRQPSNYRWK